MLSSVSWVDAAMMETMRVGEEEREDEEEERKRAGGVERENLAYR
jgi:hypothetical protein